jgi:SAM-dependent methyltransferase
MDHVLRKQIEGLISFYIANQPKDWLTYVPLFATAIALVSSFFAIYLSTKQLKTTFRNHARSEWNSLLDACITNSNFVDASYTSNYDRQTPEDYFKYQAFCYRAWSLSDFLIRHNMHKEKLYETMIMWITAFHREWLEKNPFLFSSQKFWQVYAKMQKKPLMVFQNQPLPIRQNLKATDADKINWDEVSKDYHSKILGPWSQEMMGTKPPRNCLLGALEKRANELKTQLKVLDCGCGPGNMLDYLDEKSPEIFGLDTSKEALRIAKEKATVRKVTFHEIEDDMRTYKAPAAERFDIIVSTNSVLPENRGDISKIFAAMNENLKPDGRLLLILPSFDTCLALIGYWQERLENSLRRWCGGLSTKDKEFVKRYISAFKAAKKVDEINLRYADDGENLQCFHTRESIKQDLAAAGFDILKMEKVSYPWQYTARFDYGDFREEKKEEIWDWYVEAKKKTPTLPT